VQKSNQKDNRTQTGEKRKRADGEKGAKSREGRKGPTL